MVNGLITIWCFLVSVISILLVSPIYFLIFKLSKNPFLNGHSLSQVWAKCLFFFFGIRIKVQNKEVLLKKTSYIFLSNHRSSLDIPACALTTPNAFRFLAKKELEKIPLLGWIIKTLYITVDRDNIRSKVICFKEMKEALSKGQSVWIFPEGTRGNKDIISDVEEGAFKLAIDTKTPIAVCTLIGTDDRLPNDKNWAMNMGKIIAIWSPPKYSDDAKELKSYFLKEVNHNYNQYKNETD